jgi:hypothetical protein
LENDPLFFLGYISTLSGVIAIGGMPERRGRKHEKLEPPRAIVCFYEDFYKAIFRDGAEKNQSLFFLVLFFF